MKYTLTRVGALGATSVTAGLLVFGGVAAACPTNGNSYSSYGGRGSYTTSARSDMQPSANGWMNNWNNWDPNNSSQMQLSFNDWWNGMMNRMDMSGNSWNSSTSSYADNNWTPQGSDWQQQWSNWNPMMWQANGSSYMNWRMQFMNYMMSQRSNYQDNYSWQ